MSGGVAYILDEFGDFVSKKLNKEMVKVYPLVECDDEDINHVRNLITEHEELTGSKRAENILLNWDLFVKKFIKILPQDYERVLIALKRAEERGLQGDEAVQAAFEENVAAGN